MKNFCILEEIKKSENDKSKYIDKEYIDSKDIEGHMVNGYGYYSKEINQNTGKRKYRYLLKINIDNKKENNSLNVIMFNPSESEANINKDDVFVDKTITNVIRIVNDINKNNKIYTIIKIFNLFPIISSEPNITKNDKSDNHTKFIIESIRNSDVLVAWGAILDNRKWINDIKTEIENSNANFYRFCDDEHKNYPKHPANININCCRYCLKYLETISKNVELNK